MDKELVGRRHYVISCFEDDVALRELEWHVLLGVEAVCHLCAVVMLLRLRSVGIETVPEEVLVEVGCGTSAEAEAPLVHEVARYDGGYRTDVEQ